jgi:response regulator RpfG family c-di-GMP phosphodiesterase
MNTPAAPDKVLFVDDERNILDAFERQFHKRFAIETALGPERGLELLSTHGPYAVIVSDLRMPVMTGIQFLAEAKNLAPESVRIMLTGYADTAAAVAAVNQGNIFRFLNKPCVGEVLTKTIEAAIEQHRLVTAEHVLLEQTLRGAIEVLTEMLSLLSPAVFSQTGRLRESVRHVADRLKCRGAWRFEVAAMLSHIGCIAVPPAILSKVTAAEPLSEAEARVFAAHPQVGYSLLIRIPRLEGVARMVALQQEVCENPEEFIGSDDVLLGARMLKAAIDLDFLKMAGASQADAVAAMRAQGGYNASVIEALSGFNLQAPRKELIEAGVRDLVSGMIVDQDVMARNGLLLLARGQQVTFSVIARLKSFRDTQGVVEPFRVQAVSAGYVDPFDILTS